MSALPTAGEADSKQSATKRRENTASSDVVRQYVDRRDPFLLVLSFLLARCISSSLPLRSLSPRQDFRTIQILLSFACLQCLFLIPIFLFCETCAETLVGAALLAPLVRVSRLRRAERHTSFSFATFSSVVNLFFYILLFLVIAYLAVFSQTAQEVKRKASQV